MEPLIFHKSIAKHKPNDLLGSTKVCPFCDYQETYNILEQSGEFIWTKNKYPVLEDALQTIIIETQTHEESIATYSKEKNRAMFEFAFSCWEKMRQKKGVASVAFFKNHGVLSGGSLSHAHMQIVAFERHNAYEKIAFKNFEGLEVLNEKDVRVTISEMPFSNSIEVNSMMTKEDFKIKEKRNVFFDSIQAVVKTHLAMDFASFNLFFYDLEGYYICKFTPRFPTPPYFMGFGLTQVIDESTRKEHGEKIFAQYKLQEQEG